MSVILKITILLLAIAFLFTIEFLIRRGKLKRADTYSFKSVIGEGVRALLIAFIICFLVYIYSKSFEVSLSLGIVSLVFILAGCLRSLLTEQHIKSRGGHKE